MFTVTRFERRGKKAPVIDTNDIDVTNPIQDINMLIKQQSTRIKQPRFWSFCDWNGEHGKAHYINASAIVLEYVDGVDFKAVVEGIEALDLLTWIIETENGYAFVFPLETDIEAPQYTRIASVLAEAFAQPYLVDGSAAATFLFTPRDGKKALVLHDGQPISGSFISETYEVKTDVSKWYYNPITESKIAHDRITKLAIAKADPNFTVTVDDAGHVAGFGIKGEAIARAEADQKLAKSINAVAAKRTFDDLFEPLAYATDEAIASVIKVQNQLAELRRNMEGQ